MENSLTVCEEKTYEILYNKYSKDLYSFMFYKYSSSDKAADSVQESFLKLWNNCNKVSFQKAKSYLFTVANNLFLNDKAHDKVVYNFERLPHKDYDIESPEYQLEEKEFQNTLEKAISNLKEKQRVVFVLHRIEKKKYAEIAEMLDISVKAVEKRMGLALKELRTQIKSI